jgi:Tfp pilus assembly protein PilN
MGVDLKKEIKLSDLLRRKSKDGSPEATAKPEKPEKERKPKKERGVKRGLREKKKVVANGAPELPAIPLMRAFNLMPGDEVREKTGRLALAQLLVALLGLVLVAGLGSAYIFMGARATERQGQVDDLRAQLAKLEVPAETPAAPGSSELASEGQARTAALAQALQGRVAWDRVLREVSLVLPENVYLTQISATTPAAAAASSNPAVIANPNAAPNALALVGNADKQASVAEFLARLEVIPEFATVELQSSTAADETSAFAFSIIASIAPEGAR